MKSYILKFKKKILVTGGAGYFGSVLIPQLLLAGYQVRVVDKLMFGGNGLLSIGEKIEVLVGDIRDKKLMRRAVKGIGAVVHLAALVGEPACQDEKLAWEINTEATKQLIELSKKAKVKRFVFASTCSVYGPKSVYVATKIEAEKAVLQVKSKDFCSVVLRKATLFGLSPRMRFNLLINEIARAIVFNKEIEIYNPSSWRPFVSLADAAEAYILTLRLPAKKISGKIFDVVGENIQKRKLAFFVKQKWPDAKMKLCQKGGDKRDYRTTSSQLKKLGWQPKVKVKKEMVEMVAKIRAGFLSNPFDAVTESWLDPKKISPITPIPLTTPTFGLEEEAEVVRTIRSTWITEAKKTAEFERVFANLVKAKFASAVPNGTLALAIALMALSETSTVSSVEPRSESKGSKVIVPDLTMAGSVDSAILAGLRPVLADVDEKTGNLDIEKLEALIDNKTKVIMPVHFNGRPVEMKKLLKLAKKYHLFIVEDAAQALGCFYQGRHLGTIGDMGCFSFSTSKVLTTAQGGMIVTNNKKLYEQVLRLKDHGRLGSRNIDYHDQIGFNFKFTDLQAAFGLGQMAGLKNRLQKKKEIYKRYREGLKSLISLKGLKRVHFPLTDLKTITPWLIEVWVQRRDNLVAYLNKAGIGARKIYPTLDSQPAFKKFLRAKDLSRAKKIADLGIWLPSSVDLTDDKIDDVCRKVEEFYKG